MLHHLMVASGARDSASKARELGNPCDAETPTWLDQLRCRLLVCLSAIVIAFLLAILPFPFLTVTTLT